MRVANEWDRGWEKVIIPHTWNATDMQIKTNDFYQGIGYYRKNILFQKNIKNKRIFLKFEGVSSCSEVYVNGKLAGTHKGAYGAFVVEIDQLVKPGENNEIVVKADNQARPDVIPVNHTLFGVYGGMYRPVWLIMTEKVQIAVNDCASSGVYISEKYVSTKSADIKVKVKLDNGSWYTHPVQLVNTIYTQEGKKVCSQKRKINLTPQGMQAFEMQFHINHPILWQGRENPYLYKVVSRLYDDSGNEIDKVIQPLGIRKYEIVAGRGFYLNGKKYPMYGVTRHQDYWKKGSALTNADHDRDLSLIMDIGATTVRFAHYQQADYIYSRCDSLGLIVWAEIPFVNKVTGQEAENAESQLSELIRQNYNHPSIYVWGLHNEVYQPYEYTKGLTTRLHELAKQEDPDRYTVSVNGHGNMDHPVNLNADIQAMNRYFGWYEGKISDFSTWICNLEKEYPKKRFILSEYGAGGNITHQTEYLGESLDHRQKFYPETFQTKFHEYQWSIIAKHPYIIASYLWNMFEFATPKASKGGVECRNLKGLVTFDRKIKKDAYYWYKANWSKDPVVYLTQRRNTVRERKVTTVTVYSNIGMPKVYLNGILLKGLKKGLTRVHYIFPDVVLRKGKNILKAEVTKDGKKYSDEVEWYYNGEKNRGVISVVQNKEHVGL